MARGIINKQFKGLTFESAPHFTQGMYIFYAVVYFIQFLCNLMRHSIARITWEYYPTFFSDPVASSDPIGDEFSPATSIFASCTRFRPLRLHS